jgi:hypothetical protein
MKKHAFTLTCALLLSTFAAAHGGMEHIMGTVSVLTGNSISVKATDGTTKVVGFDHDTKFMRGESTAAVGDLHVGDRVAIHAHKTGSDLHAAEVKIGISAAKAATQK